jgi:hypothetical protein
MPSLRARVFSMLAVCVGVAMPARPVTLRSDVQALLRAGIHVSVVLGPAETFDTTIEGPAEGTQDSIEAFGVRWGPVLEVSSEGRRVSLRSTRAPLCDESLLRRLALNAEGTPVELLFAIAKAADPSLATLPPPGLVNAGPGAPESMNALATRRIALSGKAVRISRALDLVAESVDGLGWWAEERCSGPSACACRIGLLTADSVVFTSYDIARKASAAPTR